MKDCIVIGSGPAGLSAAIYGKRAGLDVQVISGYELGGQLTKTTDVENYPGVGKIDGGKLMVSMIDQAKELGVEFIDGQPVSHFTKDRDIIHVTLANNEMIKTKSLIIATGASPKYLMLSSEQYYLNNGGGVSSCATCDGFFYKKKNVAVVGGGDTAFEEAIYLSKMCNKVTLINRTSNFKASDIMVQRAMKIPNIEIINNATVKEVMGDMTSVSGLRLEVAESEMLLSVSGVFIAIGHSPNSLFVRDSNNLGTDVELFVDMDDNGYIITKDTRTSEEGIFAAGDVQDTVYRQAITSAGDGCKAAMNMIRFLEDK